MLSVEDEAVIVASRRRTLLPLDGYLNTLQPTLPHLTRSSLQRRTRLDLRSVSLEPHQRRRSLGEHRAILDAITSREAEAAEQLTRERFRRTRTTLPATLRPAEQP